MKRLCKILILLICNLFILNPVFSENKDLLTRVLDAKLHTRVCESPEAALVYLKDFKASLEAENAFADKDSIDCITLSNLLNNEIYIYMYETDASVQELKDFILAQYNEIEEWKSNHGEDEYTQWFIISTWDVVNQTMQFIPQTTAIRLGLKEKQEYDSLVQKYPDFSFGYMNAALWYYFAPAIGVVRQLPLITCLKRWKQLLMIMKNFILEFSVPRFYMIRVIKRLARNFWKNVIRFFQIMSIYRLFVS